MRIYAIFIHCIRVIYGGSSTRLLNHYYTRCTELKTENSEEGNDWEKRCIKPASERAKCSDKTLPSGKYKERKVLRFNMQFKS